MQDEQIIVNAARARVAATMPNAGLTGSLLDVLNKMPNQVQVTLSSWYFPFHEGLLRENPIGSGTFGTVFVSTQSDNVVLKVQLLQRHDRSAQMLFELMTMAYVHHPNIVQFLGYSLAIFMVNSVPQLGLVTAMERLPTDLHTELNRQFELKRRGAATWSMKQCFAVVRDVARGIRALHSQSPPIIHRDIKTENVLLTFSSAAKIADFGGVVPYTPGVPVQSVSGTLPYLPVDMRRSQANATPAMDMYGLGVVAIMVVSSVVGINVTPKLAVEKNVNAKALDYPNVAETLQYIAEMPGDGMVLSRMVRRCCSEDASLRPTIQEFLGLFRPSQPVVRNISAGASGRKNKKK